MKFVWVLLAMIVIISLEVIINKRVLYLIAWIVKIPAFLFLYFVLFWYWAGDGSFNLIMVPIVFLICEAILLFVLKKWRHIYRMKIIVVNAALFIVPILTMILVDLIAKLFWIDNIVM